MIMSIRGAVALVMACVAFSMAQVSGTVSDTAVSSTPDTTAPTIGSDTAHVDSVASTGAVPAPTAGQDTLNAVPQGADNVVDTSKSAAAVSDSASVKSAAVDSVKASSRTGRDRASLITFIGLLAAMVALIVVRLL